MCSEFENIVCVICRYKQNIILMMNHNLISSNRGVFDPLSLRASPLSTFISQHPSAQQSSCPLQVATSLVDVSTCPTVCHSHRWRLPPTIEFLGIRQSMDAGEMDVMRLLFHVSFLARPQLGHNNPRVAFAMWEFRFSHLPASMSRNEVFKLDYSPASSTCWWFRNQGITSWGW